MTFQTCVDDLFRRQVGKRNDLRLVPMACHVQSPGPMAAFTRSALWRLRAGRHIAEVCVFVEPERDVLVARFADKAAEITVLCGRLVRGERCCRCDSEDGSDAKQLCPDSVHGLFGLNPADFGTEITSLGLKLWPVVSEL